VAARLVRSAVTAAIIGGLRQLAEAS
jgi:hypothetical protein